MLEPRRSSLAGTRPGKWNVLSECRQIRVARRAKERAKTARDVVKEEVALRTAGIFLAGSIQDLDRHPVRRARIDAHKGGVCVRVRLCVTCWCFGHVACELRRSAAGSSTDTVSSTRFKAYNLEGDKFAGGSAESLADLLGSHGAPAIGQL